MKGLGCTVKCGRRCTAAGSKVFVAWRERGVRLRLEARRVVGGAGGLVCALTTRAARWRAHLHMWSRVGRQGLRVAPRVSWSLRDAHRRVRQGLATGPHDDADGSRHGVRPIPSLIDELISPRLAKMRESRTKLPREQDPLMDKKAQLMAENLRRHGDRLAKDEALGRSYRKGSYGQYGSVSTTAGEQPSLPQAGDAGAASEQVVMPEKKMSKSEKLKFMYKNYGLVFMVYWTGAWVASGLTVYAGVKYFGHEATLAFIKSCGAERIVDLDQYLTNPALINVGVTVVTNELLEFARFPIVLATMPRVARLVGAVPK
ncbi:hypothetical protein FVE85_0063 [Porphyridium purpureum]|uniref:DUF1279 domain-containing protein n=1 Tax=Porphyridium purpureum TaxID=35688 RepID=A0A5J4Z031_PORPP|nr:hypothetical protein FVE85_0063 [Porphyridium purpureum]|eukprot:POR4393..scf208_2